MIEGRQTVVICGFGELGQTIANMLEVCRLLMYRAVSTFNLSILRASTARSSMARQLQQCPAWHVAVNGPQLSPTGLSDRPCPADITKRSADVQSPLAVSAGSAPPQYIGFDLQPNRVQVQRSLVVVHC